jgi:hypothetical protein
VPWTSAPAPKGSFTFYPPEVVKGVGKIHALFNPKGVPINEHAETARETLKVYEFLPPPPAMIRMLPPSLMTRSAPSCRLSSKRQRTKKLRTNRAEWNGSSASCCFCLGPLNGDSCLCKNAEQHRDLRLIACGGGKRSRVGSEESQERPPWSATSSRSPSVQVAARRAAAPLPRKAQKEQAKVPASRKYSRSSNGGLGDLPPSTSQ